MSRILVALGVLLLPPLPAPGLGQDTVEIHHINVGQGDATLILGPLRPDGSRTSVLMDAGDIPIGGDPDGGERVLQVLRQHEISQPDIFIASHYDADHLGGTVTGRPSVHGHSFLLGEDGAPGSPGDDDEDGTADWLDDRMTTPDPEELGQGDDLRVAQFIDRGDESAPDTRTYAKYTALAEASGNRLSIDSQTGVDTLVIDLGKGARMTLLAANGNVRDRSTAVQFANTENERSLCFHLEHQAFDYLLCGDLTGREFGGENAEVEQAVGHYLVGEGIDVDVLHVNHHGANNASDLGFLEMIRADIAVISVGNGNSFSHPHSDALNRLTAAGVQAIYQTEWGTTEGQIPDAVRRKQAIYQGNILIKTDGSSFTVSTRRQYPTDEEGS